MSGVDEGVAPIYKHISQLFFMSNFTGKPLTHLWTISVEFQFYLISPFILFRMTSYKVPLALCLFSTLLNFGMTFWLCKPFFPDARDWDQTHLKDYCNTQYEILVGNQMLMRMSPYVIGMYASKKYLEGAKAPNLMLEWIAFVVLSIISMWLGIAADLNQFILPPAFTTIWQCLGR
jgi:peptidoglycan/LPS O-acetylase OafA/YrhL